MFGITFLYLIISPKIYLDWFKIFLKIIPFFVSYFIFGMIFNVSFITQSFVSIRIMFMLLLSVYLISTTSMEGFLSNSTLISKNKIFSEIAFFIVATVYFIPILSKQYKISAQKSRNIFQILPDAFTMSFQKISHVEKTVSEKLEKCNFKSRFYVLPNLYLVLLALIYLLIIIRVHP
ncbi:MAG: hypothetical protein HQ534_01990 [Armatimonadetes bacterium]|nr:hypothetical protein [Armatimonadota bacterium]